MTTIDRLDFAIHVQYARRAQYMENVQQKYHLEEAHTIPPQTAVVDIYPRPSEMDMLFGVVRTYAPWAYFYPPKKFLSQRRSPFSSFRVAPTLGSLEKQESDAAKLAGFACSSPQEEEEKEALSSCLDQIDKLNDLLGYILGRIGQFLQG